MSKQNQEILLILLTIGILGGLYFHNIGGWLINDDEGTFLYQAWRVSEGDRPYVDFFTSHNPLFLYTAGTLMGLSGRSISAIRAVSVLLTMTSAFIVFLLARRFLSVEGAWLAMLTFLLHPEVFFCGRFLYAEPFMLFFDMLGLYLFDRGWNERRSKLLAVAGLSFGIATFYKPMGLLPLVGCGLWAIIDIWRQRTNWRSLIAQGMAFLLPFVLLVGLLFLSFMHRESAFYTSAVGVHLIQGQELGRMQVVGKGVVFLLRYFVYYVSLIVFALPAAWTSRRDNRRGILIAWQLPTALIFLFLSLDLYSRHLFYLIPSLAILFALALDPLRRWAGRSFLFVAVIGAVLLPWTMEDTMLTMRTEQDTASIAELIRSRIDEAAYLLSDYQELNFHAARRSTYLGAEISRGMVGSEQITGERLIEEIKKYQVEMVILDVSSETAHQLVNLTDYERFHAYVKENFELVGRFPRSVQLLEIYVRDKAD
jgi:4-amino-4-deoxy-L-arabinose transferase-like glycosyltransferase